MSYKEIREEKIKDASKKRLLDEAKKRIQTTMIGAIDIIQKELSDYNIDGVLSEIRSKILDKGNNQIRNLEVEFSKYDIISKTRGIISPIERDKK